MNRLKGKVAIVTGGARGIGAAIAKLFATNGAYVIIADVLNELGQQVASTIGGSYVHCNVANEFDVESAVEQALSRHGRLDIMVNNAGVAGPDGSITNIDMNELGKVLAINLNGVVHGIKHAARAMVTAKRGCILCICSSAATTGGLASHSYTMSKAAMLGLVKSAACELGLHGVRINCISPHGVATEMLIGAHRQFAGEELHLDRILLEKSTLRGRSATVNDVAQAALFLASDDAGYVNAHNLVVDGGFTSIHPGLSFIYR